MDIEKPQHRYENILMDSARWEKFSVRDNDIIISTPYKAGTTWTQKICSLLIYQEENLNAEINKLSPWLDAKFASIESVIQTYEAQSARRFIKTHTPLSGLPYFPQAKYIVVGRDPRDIFMSMQHHYANMNPGKFAELLELSENELKNVPELPDDLNERFKLWLTRASYPWEQDGFPLWSVFNHLQSFWKIRDRGNIHFMLYENMLDDLLGEMRGLASFLGIEVADPLWPKFLAAASFTNMKNRPDATRPTPIRACGSSQASSFTRVEAVNGRASYRLKI